MVVRGVLGVGVTLLLLLAVVEGGQEVEGAAAPFTDEYPVLGVDYPGEVVDYPGQLDYLDAEHYYTNHFTPDLSNSTLRKCRCAGEEVWGKGACHPHDTIVAIVDPQTGQRVAANTSSLTRVVVGQVKCPAPRVSALLDSNRHPEHEFSLEESGHLYWQGETFSDYCLEHTYTPDGEPSAWEAQVCLNPPSVPRCCPSGYALHILDGCVPEVGVVWSPPVQVQEQVVAWGQVEGDVVNITCDAQSETQHVEVGGEGGATLLYSPQSALLSWTPPTELKPKQHQDYCVGVEAGAAGRYLAKLCYTDPMKAHRQACNNTTCVRKCCPQGSFFWQECVPVEAQEEEWQPEFHYPDTLAAGAPPPHPLTFVYGFPLCPSCFQLETYRTEEDKFYLLTDGSLHVPIFSKVFPPDQYCLDKFLTDTGQVHTLPLVCFQEDDASASSACKAVQLYVYPVLLVVSCVFLAITLLIYVSVPELHAKVHGKCLVSHVSALLLAYVSLVTVQWSTGLMPLAACKVMASVIHFSFMAAFFWLNVMCFDIWWTLKSMRPVAETGELSRLRFKMYSMYAWGCPIVISLAAIIVQTLPPNIQVVRPEFGNKKCWFDNDKSLWAYFYGFVLVLVIANIIFFAQVAYILLVAQNDPILQRTRQQNRERMWLYIKLFLVMGLTWLAEVISWQEGTCEAWMITDIINTLQGSSIFLIFICKRNMLRRIRNNWEPYLRRVKEFFGSSRQSQSKTGKRSQESTSFSSSVNRPSHSAASQRTVQSQISFDPSSASRKLSASSLVSTTGAQIHSPNSISMDTINEVTSPEGEQAEKSNASPEESTCLPIAINPWNVSESTSTNSITTGDQCTPMSELNSVVEHMDDDCLPNSNDEPTLSSVKEASLRLSNEDVPTSQIDHKESASIRDGEREVPSRSVKEATHQTESENTTQQRKCVNAAPAKTTENATVKTHDDTEIFGIGNGSVPPRHHRAFTTDDEDDQPVDV
ncbi:hypothetical protein OTU49_011043 [Cherax quadricarinatus]|uniref:G-protein coupled receptors family 2 profile 2 domain-containing protein n=1 Tax=Cherax quadricarinatus TaxID=27406 RepID=A0AAW0W705_CHEQU